MNDETLKDGAQGEPVRLRAVQTSFGHERLAVWGGPLIHRLRGWEPREVAEEWLVSTHPAGLSFVETDVGRVSLRSTQAGDVPFMIKYLDCEEPLSVQVHPNPGAIEALRKAGYAMPDTGAKEESFFVVRRAERDCNVLLGFNLAHLEPIAARLRATLKRHIFPLLAPPAGEFDDLDSSRTRPDALASRLANDLRDALLLGSGDESNAWISKDGTREESMYPFERLASWAVAQAQVLPPGSIDVLKRVTERAATYLREADPDVEAAIDFHANGLPRHGFEGAAELLGKQYLFAGVGIIWFLMAMKRALIAERDELAKIPLSRVRRSARARLRRLVWLLYGNSRGHAAVAAPSPLLDFFNRYRVEAGQWIRVPPGMIHAWQGGGNLLVELSEKSDNTFRMLDYGREVLGPGREMHYGAAMFALTNASVVGDRPDGPSTFIAEAHPHGEVSEEPASPAAHALMNYQFCLGGESGSTWTPLPRPKDFDGNSSQISAILNPYHPVSLRPTVRPAVRASGDTDSTTVPPDVTVGALGAAVVYHEAMEYQSIELRREGQGGPILHLYPRSPEVHLILSVGETRLKCALWTDATRPSLRWQPCGRSVSTLTNSLSSLLRGGQKLLKAAIQDGSISRRLSRGSLKIAVLRPSQASFEEVVMGLRAGAESLFSEGSNPSATGTPQDPDDVSAISLIVDALGPPIGGDSVDHSAGESCFVIPEATVGALGEHRHPLGRLRDPGILLHLGSTVYAGCFDPEASEQAESRSVAAMIDSLFHLTRRRLAVRFLARLWRLGLQCVPPPASVPGHVPGETALDFLMRTSRIDSNFEFAWQSPLGTPGRREGEDPTLGDFKSFEAGSFFYALSQMASSDVGELGRAVRSFYREVASEISQAIQSYVGALGRPTEPGFPAFELRLRRIVLAGSVGNGFGYVGEHDALLEHIRQDLRSAPTGGEVEVFRSRIAVASERDAEGFRHYLMSRRRALFQAE